MENVITFDASLKEEMLDIFDIIVNENGYLVEKSNPINQVIEGGRPIHIDEFAGVTSKDGKPFFLRNDIASLIEISDKLNKEE